MNEIILLVLANKWEQDVKIQSQVLDGSHAADISNAIEKGHRECKRECADTLRTLVDMLGEKPTE